MISLYSVARNVVVTDAVPDGLTLVEGSISHNGTYETDENGIVTITWKLGDMPEGKIEILSFKVTIPEVKEDTEWTNVALLTYEKPVIPGDPDDPDNPYDPENPPPPEKPEIPSNEVEVEVKTGSLTVTKTVTGNIGDKNKAFTFTVTLGDTTINGVYGDMEFKDGVATFTLKHGKSKTATGLPVGITYTVVETDSEDYQVTAKNASGTISDDEITAAYYNNRNYIPRVSTGSLTISKTVVSDDDADYSAEFTFIVSLSDAYGSPLMGSFPYSGSKSGSISNGGMITLKHGESITITGLPSGATYSVTELVSEDFDSEAMGSSGMIFANTTSSAAFTNYKLIKPETPEEGILGGGTDENVIFDDTSARNGVFSVGIMFVLGLVLMLASVLKCNR